MDYACGIPWPWEAGALNRKARKSRHPPGYPGDWRPPLAGRRRPRIGLILATLAAVLAVAALGYALLLDFQGAAQRAAGSSPRPDAPARQSTAPTKPGTVTPRTGEILTCPDPDGGSFYTNAPSCAEADLHNRVNVVPARAAARPVAADCLGASGPQRAHLFLPQCQEVFNQALELERFLVKAEDPLQSPRAQEYCALIAEGVSAGCMATSATFCYLYLCQQLVDQE